MAVTMDENYQHPVESIRRAGLPPTAVRVGVIGVVSGLVLWALVVLVGPLKDPDAVGPEAASFFEPVGPVSLLVAGEPEAARAQDAPRERPPVPSGDTAVVPDSKLRLDVGLKLEDSELNASTIQVRVEDQYVILSGAVGSMLQRDQAELIAREVTGVRGVENRLQIR